MRRGSRGRARPRRPEEARQPGLAERLVFLDLKKKKPRKIRYVFPGVYESSDAELSFVLFCFVLRRFGLSETP